MKNKNSIIIKGARVHNLKNIDVEIPRDKMVVITGISGSGKSSLAFDTIYAEGQRRYVESLSAYARQFIGLMDKPDVDLIEGLSPAISIDQKSASHNPRSTVGTVTEIYDYLRLLFARIGDPFCPRCGKPIRSHTVDEIVDNIMKKYADQDLVIFAPLVKGKKGEHKKIMEKIEEAGFARIRLDGAIYPLEEAKDMEIDKMKKHTLEIMIDRLKASPGKEDKARLNEAVEKALDLSNGSVTVALANPPRFVDELERYADPEELKGAAERRAKKGVSRMKMAKEEYETAYSRLFACPECEISLPEIEPRLFSFNNPHGACPECGGLGTKMEIDPELILNKNLTLAQGAVRPWSHGTVTGQTWLLRILGTVAQKNGFDLNTPLDTLAKKQMDIVLYGTGDKNYNVSYESDRFSGELTTEFEGVVNNLERRYRQTESDYVRREIENYMRVLPCPACGGKRLRSEALAVKVDGRTIHEVTSRSIIKTRDFFSALENSGFMTARKKKIAAQILKEIRSRIDFLLNVGLDYLTLSRAANTLSGGEAQRIRLATQIGSALVGVLYVLDEPSIGLHQKDNDKLIATLKSLRDLGNTVIVVEHDEATIMASDWIVDVGPGAGEHGGEIIMSGTPQALAKSSKSITGQYLAGKKSIEIPRQYRTGNGKELAVKGARENNLKNIDVAIPLGKFVAITGVSGSGKSTLMTDILSKALSRHFHRSKEIPGAHDRIEGLHNLDKVISIDQSPIGRTPRSNPATYTGAFTPIRELFAALPEARIRGYKAGRFSFNVPGGRCEACSGDGLVKIEMQFLPDVYVECEVCQGSRYNKEALEIHYRGKNISDILNLTVEEAAKFFSNIPAVSQKLETLSEVGLGYIKLGQSATTLSGGEAQRVKLATELSRRATGKTLYILDEPTTGLHFDDTNRLLSVLHKLVDKGNSILIIEHNLDVIKSVDHIIDLGPEGGDRGGEVIAQGTPEEVAKNRKSYTGRYLSKMLK